MTCITSIGKASPQTNGYATVYDPRIQKKVKAHRWVFEKFWGPIPKGLVVKHSCDNRACTNINHLSLDTQGGNLLDMWRRGRGGHRNIRRGDGHNMVAIPNAEVAKIRQMDYYNGMYTDSAKKYKTTRQTIRNIFLHKTRKNYKAPDLKDLV